MISLGFRRPISLARAMLTRKSHQIGEEMRIVGLDSPGQGLHLFGCVGLGIEHLAARAENPADAPEKGGTREPLVGASIG